TDASRGFYKGHFVAVRLQPLRKDNAVPRPRRQHREGLIALLHAKSLRTFRAVAPRRCARSRLIVPDALRFDRKERASPSQEKDGPLNFQRDPSSPRERTLPPAASTPVAGGRRPIRVRKRDRSPNVQTRLRALRHRRWQHGQAATIP